MTIQELNSGFEAVNKGLAVIYFFFPQNNICEKFTPLVEEVSDEFPNFKFYKVDASLNKEFAKKYGIKSIPAIVVIKNGKVIGQGEGATDKETLKQHVEQAIKNGS